MRHHFITIHLVDGKTSTRCCAHCLMLEVDVSGAWEFVGYRTPGGNTAYCKEYECMGAFTGRLQSVLQNISNMPTRGFTMGLHELVDVQPLNGPTGTVFYMNMKRVVPPWWKRVHLKSARAWQRFHRKAKAQSIRFCRWVRGCSGRPPEKKRDDM